MKSVITVKKIYFFVFIIPIAALFTISSLYIERQLEFWMMDRVQTELEREAKTIKGVLAVTTEPMRVDTLDPLIDNLADDSPFRLTIIRDDGVVMADSWVATQKIYGVKSHGERPEIISARTQQIGRATRFSATVGADLSYLAIPISTEKFHGFVRAAIPLDSTRASVDQLKKLLVESGIIGLILLTIIILFAMRYINQVNNTHKQELERKVESRTKDIEQIQTFGQMLTGCESIDEIVDAVLAAAPAIFENTSGAISLIPPSSDQIEVMATWGEDWHPIKTYLPNDCWAFRRGTNHLSEKNSFGFNCKHFTSDDPVLCVPFVAQGVCLGAIHIKAGEGANIERLQSIASTVAEHLSLSMTNVNLRTSLKYQAVRDPLTNLYNRRYLDESLSRDIHRSERRGTSLGVLMIDVDHFKKFNDTFGHDAGDFVLQRLGAELAEAIRDEDIACRYGGEEFTIVFPDADLPTIAKRATDILERVREMNLEFRNRTLGHITLSIGIAVYPHHGEDGETLISVADRALYAAKNAGRDQIKIAPLPSEVDQSFTDNPWISEDVPFDERAYNERAIDALMLENPGSADDEKKAV